MEPKWERRDRKKKTKKIFKINVFWQLFNILFMNLKI